MVEFLQMDLNYEEQPATIRLNDTISTILQAYFNVDGATITRFGISGKHEQFHLAPREIQELCAAWTEYQARLAQHAIDVAEHKKATVAKAKELAKSVQFDLPEMNVRGILNNNGWKVLVPALGFEQYASTADDLLQTVQEALDKIKRDVEHAEKSGWCGDWNEIIASYRRVFPLVEQKILAEIQEARDLLAAMPDGHADWELHEYEGWSLRDGQTIVFTNVAPEHVLNYVKVYVRKIDMEEEEAGQGEPTEITEARELLKNSLHPADWAIIAVYPGTDNDCWSFDNGLDGETHWAMFNKPAATILEFVKGYLASQQAPGLSALPE